MSDEMIPFGRPLLDQTEIDAVLKVLSGPILAHGPVCVEFEQAFAERAGAEQLGARANAAAQVARPTPARTAQRRWVAQRRRVGPAGPASPALRA